MRSLSCWEGHGFVLNFPGYKRCAAISPPPSGPWFISSESQGQHAYQGSSHRLPPLWLLSTALSSPCSFTSSCHFSEILHLSLTVTGDGGSMELPWPPAMQVCKVPTPRVITRTDGGRRTSFSTGLRHPSPDPLRELSEIEIILMKRHIPQSFKCWPSKPERTF